MDYAELAIIDLSKAQTPEGRAELAMLARDAMREHGFFYVINHGLTQEQVGGRQCDSAPVYTYHIGLQEDRIFDIANVPFAQVSDEEKLRYNGKMLETGSYQGYKLRQYWVRDRHLVSLFR